MIAASLEKYFLFFLLLCQGKRQLLPILSSLIVYNEVEEGKAISSTPQNRRHESKPLGNSKGMEKTSAGIVKKERKSIINCLSLRYAGRKKTHCRLKCCATMYGVCLQIEQITRYSRSFRYLVDAELQHIFCPDRITWAFCWDREVLPSFSCSIVKTWLQSSIQRQFDNASNFV